MSKMHSLYFLSSSHCSGYLNLHIHLSSLGLLVLRRPSPSSRPVFDHAFNQNLDIDAQLDPVSEPWALPPGPVVATHPVATQKRTTGVSLVTILDAGDVEAVLELISKIRCSAKTTCWVIYLRPWRRTAPPREPSASDSRRLYFLISQVLGYVNRVPEGRSKVYR
jgi:hypothetical protein